MIIMYIIFVFVKFSMIIKLATKKNLIVLAKKSSRTLFILFYHFCAVVMENFSLININDEGLN